MRRVEHDSHQATCKCTDHRNSDNPSVERQGQVSEVLERRTSDPRAWALLLRFRAPGSSVAVPLVDLPGEDPSNGSPVDRPEVAVAESDTDGGSGDAHLRGRNASSAFCLVSPESRRLHNVQ